MNSTQNVRIDTTTPRIGGSEDNRDEAIAARVHTNTRAEDIALSRKLFG